MTGRGRCAYPSTMGGKRDSKYYLQRLKAEHPKVFADYRAGKHPSVRDAAAKAGLIKVPTPLTILKREWTKATAAERKEFETWSASKSGSPRSRLLPIVGADGLLRVPAIAVISMWCMVNEKTPGALLAELGFKRRDFRLAAALKRNEKLPDDIVKALEAWLVKTPRLFR